MVHATPTTEDTMHASAGDRLIIKAHRLGERDRDAMILAVRGESGTPPYLVRWEDDGHESLLFPGSDAEVHHYGATREPVGAGHWGAR
jgi:hypothetical protein